MTIFIVCLILISIWVGFYQLVKQQGRMLLRLDELERSVRAAMHSRMAEPTLAQPEGTVAEGLAVGTEFPDFELADLSGMARRLSDFRSKRTLLIHWNFECGFCEALAGDLAGLESDLAAQNSELLLIAFGNASFNLEQAARHGLRATILLLDKNQSPAPFQHQGTPVAYWLDENLRVAAPFASGLDEVVALARVAASEAKLGRARLKSERSLSESRIERNGLRSGTTAPSFRLPDLDGRSIALDDYRGRRLLLVFSDPHCGPCDELAPQLASLHREHRDNGLAVVMVGRGDKEENRKKAEKFGFEFPVVLQERWKLSKEYGIFATPVAFLIAEDGVIAREVAVGKDAILGLAAEAAKMEESRVL